MHRQFPAFVIALVVLVIALASVGLVGLHWASQPSYFPDGSLDASFGRSDAFRNKWYSSQLGAMDEPVLKAGAGGRAYRFTWLRSFHHPVAVRIVHASTGAHLVAVELDGAGGYSPGSVLRRKDAPLSDAEFSEIERLIDQSGFWEMASIESTNGRDGADWIVEGATTRYHVVTRWTPESGTVREIGMHFLSLTGWDFPENETY